MNESKKNKTSEDNLNKDWSAAIEQLFFYAREKDNNKFISALNPPIVHIKFTLPTLNNKISYLDDYMDQELSEAIKIYSLFAQLVKSPKVKREQKMRFMLITFFHLLEADAWHVILDGLLRTITASNYENGLRNKDLKTKRQRIIALFKECKKKKINLSIEKLYDDICSKNIGGLRNAFSHCQYLVWAEGNWLMTTKNIYENIPTSESDEKKKQRESRDKMCYSFDEVVEMYENIIAFLKTLAYERKEALERPPK